MTTPYTQPVILIVTDDLSKLAFLKKHLKEEFHLLEKTDETAVLDIVQNSIIDTIIIDAALKDISAFTLCEKIRSISGYYETPILLITPSLKKSYMEDALIAGASDFLNEPLEKRELEARIAVALKMKKREEKIAQMALLGTPQSSSVDLSKRKVLSDKAIKAIAKARKNSELISLLMVELDSQKEDSKAQLQLTEILQKQLRQHDILIPQGNGKYIVMLPKTSNRAAEMIAETVRSEVQGSDLSVSIGLISFDSKSEAFGSAAEAFDQLIESADRAMTEAKKTGNRIIREDLC